MESHGGRSLETPRGVAAAHPAAAAAAAAGSSDEHRTMAPLLLPLDVREGDIPFRRVPDAPPPLPASSLSSSSSLQRRAVSQQQQHHHHPQHHPPVGVHSSRPQMALVTAPPPQTCVLQPITSSGPIRTSNLVRSSSRSTTGGNRRVAGASPGEVPRSNFSTVSSSSGRLENSFAAPPTPVLSGRTHSVSGGIGTSRSSRSGPGTSSAGTGSVDVVSLTLPRPETERTANEYVETPLRSGPSLIEPKSDAPGRFLRGIANGDLAAAGSGHQHRDSNFAMVTLPVTGLERISGKPESAPTSTTTAERGNSQYRQQGGEKKSVVTSQPSATFKKERYHSESQCSRQNDDIICSECKRCRCESCRTPRPLPSKWLCGTCHCSAESIVDYVTCLCCAKAFFYHCSNDESVSEENDPCSCQPNKLYARWSCLGLLSCFFPCLLCYWPLRGLVQICESCHRYYSSQGCRCQKLYQQPAPLAFEKRLLDSPE